MTAKLDIYSDMRLPFTVAAFCRTRKHNPESVALSRMLRADAEIRAKIAELTEILERNTSAIAGQVKKVEEIMERDNAN